MGVGEVGRGAVRGDILRVGKRGVFEGEEPRGSLTVLPAFMEREFFSILVACSWLSQGTRVGR